MPFKEVIFISELMQPRKYSFYQHSSKASSVQFLLKAMLYFIFTIEYKRERLNCITSLAKISKFNENKYT